MEESKRQKQVGRLIQEEMSSIFLKDSLNMSHGGMISISKVIVTPDLLEARIYLSLFQVSNEEAYMENISEKINDLRHTLGNNLRHQLRRIPSLTFFLDDTLDHVFKMEELLKKIKNQ